MVCYIHYQHTKRSFFHLFFLFLIKAAFQKAAFLSFKALAKKISRNGRTFCIGVLASGSSFLIGKLKKISTSCSFCSNAKTQTNPFLRRTG
ncbi:MAG: hypothetical protein A2464_06345 [Deltaproteobacteria bacterium RIFOXYC2_FULL_48_10]|nr:MAG: hypothetical protein A2464_06345 [Deltaproteobacteria bacterium RIFOXYC2_FULL_48_10]OGR32692.1 MAG: hypothetical protein A3J80_02395 [Desulfobacula sp. RIFOXYB2_FULL_45_6]